MEPKGHLDQTELARSDADRDCTSGHGAPWPVCPDCERRRQTRCPTCQLGGDDFPKADMFFTPHRSTARTCSACSPLEPDELANNDQDSAVMRMCPVCEEAFTPVFYRRCQQCGHDFGDGLLVQTPEPYELTDRALIVLAGMIGLFIALIAYFWLVISLPG